MTFAAFLTLGNRSRVPAQEITDARPVVLDHILFAGERHNSAGNESVVRSETRLKQLIKRVVVRENCVCSGQNDCCFAIPNVDKLLIFELSLHFLVSMRILEQILLF